MPTIFKKIDEKTFERINTNSEVTILDKEQLEQAKKFLEGEIAKFQAQLDRVNENLEGIRKAK